MTAIALPTAVSLVVPAREHLDSFAAALRTGWSPNNVRDVSGEFLAEIEADADLFLANRNRADGRYMKPDGTFQQMLPFITRWIWDGAFCGHVNLRWPADLGPLPEHVPGHLGYAVVPWKRRLGYAKLASAAALVEARKLGLSRIEVTTDLDNVPSRRIIEGQGGHLVEEFRHPLFGDKPKLRYEVAL